MSKLYILICAIVLSGCGDSVYCSVDTYNKANKYCTENKGTLIIYLNGWDDQTLRMVKRLECNINGNAYTIPKEALK